MKTSEFIKYVKENWFTTWEHGDNVINIAGIMKVHTNRQLIEFDKKIATNSNHFRLIEKAIEYTETPIEEREEEEKKYMLRTPFDRYVYLNSFKNNYLFAGRIQENGYKTRFTQEEINDMPFDTNFFIKEEV